MSGAASPGDDNLETPFLGTPCVFEQEIRCPMSRKQPHLVGDSQLLEQVDGVLHGLPVGAGAHYNANERLSHKEGDGSEDGERQDYGELPPDLVLRQARRQ